MAGITTAVRRVGRHTQDWLNRYTHASTLFQPATINATDSTITLTPWISTASASITSEWAEVADAGVTLVQVNFSAAGTFTIQGSLDGGANFYALRGYDMSTEAVFAATAITAAGIYRYTGPYQFLRLVVTANTGTIEAWFAALRT